MRSNLLIPEAERTGIR
jgi:hypothetical protein